MSDENTKDVEVVQGEGAAEKPPVAKGKKAKGSPVAIIVVVVLLLVVLGALHYSGVLPSLERTDTDDSSSMQGDQDESAVVATVNGAEVTRGELNERLDQIRASVPEGSPDPTQDAAFELQIADELVNLALLKQEAEKQGFTVSDEDVASEIEEVTKIFGTEEALEAQLDAVGLTREEFERNVRNELLIRQVVEANTDINNVSVSDEEIQAAYESNFEGQENAPSLEDASDFIKEQLTQQKTNAIIQAYLEKVRADADIQLML